MSQGTFSVDAALLRDLAKELEQIDSMVSDGPASSIDSFAAALVEDSLILSLWDFHDNAGSRREVFTHKLKTFSSNLHDAADSYDYVDKHIVPASP